MKINVRRFEFSDTYTISKVTTDVDPEWCYCLEDKTREVEGQPVSAWKVAGSTAIPRGTYKVIVDFSNHFQKNLPHILDVPGYEGVRIHPGNTSADTEGCLLVGEGWSGSDMIYNSRKAFEPLFQKIAAACAAGEEVWLTLE